MNKWFFTGRLINDPEYRDVAGVKAATMTLSVRTRGKDDQGYPKSLLARCTCWRKMAELCEQFGVGKGKTLAISGMLDMREYTNKDGVLCKSLEVDVSDIDFLLDGKKQEANDGTLMASPATAQQPQPVDVGEELPF